MCDGTRGGDDEGWGAGKAGVQMFASVPGRGSKYSGVCSTNEPKGRTGGEDSFGCVVGLSWSGAVSVPLELECLLTTE